VKQAKASPDEVANLIRFLTSLDDGQTHVPPWRRVVHGYEVLVDNCCDPAVSHLAFKPEILNAKARIEELNQLYTGEAQLHAELKTQVDGWKEQIRVLRAALVGLVGVDTREELEAMRTWLLNSPAGKETVVAVQALLDTEAPK
jgi:hypothetical protein